MGTRGIIARKTPGGWIGRYHHWDSYPKGLGKTLFALANGHFKDDLAKMMRVLTVEHLKLGIETYDPDVNFTRVQAGRPGGYDTSAVDRIRARWEKR